MSESKSVVDERVEKICNRLRLLLSQWVESVPIISDASAVTFVSQIHLLTDLLKEKHELATHDMPLLLMQTLSQLWDNEENEDILVKNDILEAVFNLYQGVSQILLPICTPSVDENHYSEFLNLLSVVVGYTCKQ